MAAAPSKDRRVGGRWRSSRPPPRSSSKAGGRAGDASGAVPGARTGAAPSARVRGSSRPRPGRTARRNRVDRVREGNGEALRSRCRSCRADTASIRSTVRLGTKWSQHGTQSSRRRPLRQGPAETRISRCRSSHLQLRPRLRIWSSSTSERPPIFGIASFCPGEIMFGLPPITALFAS